MTALYLIFGLVSYYFISVHDARVFYRMRHEAEMKRIQRHIEHARRFHMHNRRA